jgi:hypothetical protein
VDAAAFPECPDKHLGSRAVAFQVPAERAAVPAEVVRQEGAVAGEEAADSRAKP